MHLLCCVCFQAEEKHYEHYLENTGVMMARQSQISENRKEASWLKNRTMEQELFYLNATKQWEWCSNPWNCELLKENGKCQWIWMECLIVLWYTVLDLIQRSVEPLIRPWYNQVWLSATKLSHPSRAQIYKCIVLLILVMGGWSTLVENQLIIVMIDYGKS